jgi:chromate reductase, NAD(P)H dehydrogenase (quinone)
MTFAPIEPLPTLLLVPGSMRRESFNARLLQDLAWRLQGRCRVDFLAPEQVELPLFDQDLEADPQMILRLAGLHRRFSACHGMIVASPEYNGQLPPYLKNLIDWTSRLAHIDPRFDNPFLDRPVLLCSATTGSSGGAVAMASARALFAYIGCLVIGDRLCLPYAAESWTDVGYLFEPFFDERIDSALGRVLRLAGNFAQSAARQS